MGMISKVRAFVLGVYEHKLDCTTHFGEPEIEWYDKGRDVAKRLYALFTEEQ
jgi:hypothetical protein